MLGFLEDPKANQVNNLFEICISRLKTINTAYALRAFMQSLSEQQMTGLCRHFRAQICAHFESIDDYNYILRQLTAQQQTILCTQLQRHLIDLLKTPSDFTQIMRYTDVDFIHQLFHEFKAIYFVNIMDAAIRDTQVCAFFIKVMGTIDLSKRKAVFQHLLCHEQTENQAVQRFSEKYTALFSHSLRSFFSKSNFITQQNPLTCQKIIDHAAKEPGSRTAEVIYCWM